MKPKHLILVLCLLFTMPAVAQNELWEKYSNAQDVIFVSISKSMIETMPVGEMIGTPELQDFTKKMESMKILFSETSGVVKPIFEDFLNAKKSNYEELMHVKIGDLNSYFYVRKKGEIIKELLMISTKAIIQINGDFTLQDIQKISAAVESKLR